MVVPRALAVVCLILLAGCSGGATEETEDTPPVDVLRAVILASVNGTNLAILNGTVAVDEGVPVTFDASASNGTNLRYEWVLGNTTSSDVSVEHAFAAPGPHNVTLTVRSGNETASSSLRVDVVPAPVSTLVTTLSFPFSDDLPLGNPNAPTNAGIDHNDHPVGIVAEIDGQAVEAREIRLILDGSGAAAVDMYLYWRDASGNLAQDTSSGLDKTLVVPGPTAAGDYNARVRLFAGAQGTYDLTVEVDYWSVV